MRQYAPLLYIIGLLGIMVGMFIPIFTNDITSMTFRWIFAAGAAITLLSRALQPAPNKDLPMRIRRLFRLETWSAVLYCVAAGFVFYDRTQIRDWVAFTLAGAVLQIYSAVALSFAIKKLQK